MKNNKQKAMGMKTLSGVLTSWRIAGAKQNISEQ